MKKTFFSILCLGFSIFSYSQDQVVNGAILQNINNYWLSPATIQIGRSNSTNYKDRAVIGVTNGNLHFDSYSGKSIYLNYYVGDDFTGNKGLMIDPNGNVGIGTETPQYKLQVFGDIAVGDQSGPEGTIGAGNRLYLGGIADNTDPMWIGRYNTGWNRSDLRINIGDDGAGEDRFLIGNIYVEDNNWHSWFSVVNNGNVGIGTDNPQNKLDVNGTIRATEVKVEAGWADFVFDKDYKLPTLQEVENHINEHKHLPDIPSEAEVKENGVSLGEMQAKLLQKIEELTLYVIELKKENQEQSKLIHDLQGKLE